MRNVDTIKTTTNRADCFGSLTTNLTKDYSEKAFGCNFRFPIRRCFGSAEKINPKAFSFGVVMPQKRNDDYATYLYNHRYLKGLSLSQIAKEENKTRQSIFKIFKVRGFVLRTTTKLSFQEFNSIKFTLRNNGYLARTDGNRELISKSEHARQHSTGCNGFVHKCGKERDAHT